MEFINEYIALWESTGMGWESIILGTVIWLGIIGLLTYIAYLMETKLDT